VRTRVRSGGTTRPVTESGAPVTREIRRAPETRAAQRRIVPPEIAARGGRWVRSRKCRCVDERTHVCGMASTSVSSQAKIAAMRHNALLVQTMLHSSRHMDSVTSGLCNRHPKAIEQCRRGGRVPGADSRAGRSTKSRLRSAGVTYFRYRLFVSNYYVSCVDLW